MTATNTILLAPHLNAIDRQVNPDIMFRNLLSSLEYYFFVFRILQLTSTKTQLPYRYYTLPYCQPEQIHEARGNLGSALLGDAVENSPYDIKMLETKQCVTLCTKTLGAEEKKLLKSMIDEDYQVVCRKLQLQV